ncbi:SDR family oxidoreductase [Amycolatopsis cynarae]|uniref:SDR family oxidoreductase n=1 Tax=Amycolatopsis cynarae TaxID=2995223 RepID=A0ABY7B5I3_9PSEU|nr:SDR family oxidoreductase [Amycolatopsis sp. HUAS 11-8]WAL67592.1 SDR family oxidoreductase [Amycolatopsis sp. HUAS 11-8]
MIVITGATGQLGRHVVKALLDRLPAEQVVAAVRSPEKAADLGVAVRKADYDQPETLASALEGADKVLLISGSEVGKRVPQHQAVLEAAQKAGVAHLVYTSAPKADSSPLTVNPEHKATEALIRASGLPFTVLRNNWYHENYVATIEQAVRNGSFAGSAGDGRVASATRADYAAAAAAVLTGEGHENKVYELTGDTAWTYEELAAEIAKAAGKPVTYTDLDPEQHRTALTGAGLPEGTAGFVVALDADIKQGLLGETSADLRTLTGRPATPLAVFVGETVRSL